MADKIEELHMAVCNAVHIMNMSPDIAQSSDGRKARDILRQALIDYADAFMAAPVTDHEREAIARKHRKMP
jgi:hypothetical protein